MKEALRIAIDEAFLQASIATGVQDHQKAFRWLERAHILTQRMPLLHARSHWLMLQLGWRTRDFRELAGQIPRILAALLFSRIWVPIGNTGRARVSALAPMPIPADLQQLLRETEPMP
ncbi:DUF3703 domain-containing protein [Pseudomonas sp. 2FG]|uniref:DUF3703 domain-containing protein n=1 Tax=Pseudomonas sp. 2FG TaxID=2502191 RepID=UPI0010FA1E0F|nr:DUF3703 domain-containing protein [Pseudomonas sp. 2FG]